MKSTFVATVLLAAAFALPSFAADAAKGDPTKNRALHLHPRDGKQ